MFVRTAYDIGKLIRAARKTQGWTQAELARRLGSTQKWVSQIENGRPGADLDLVLRALNLLQVTLDGHLPLDIRSAAAPGSAELVNRIADRGLGYNRKKGGGKED